MHSTVTRFVRFESPRGTPVWGVLEGDQVAEIDASPLGPWHKTSRSHPRTSVHLLVPAEPRQVFALAGNYKSHLPGETLTERQKVPQPFLKPPSCLIPDGAPIIIPPGTSEVHFEAELVVVIGQKAREVSEDRALEYVLGVTCGNDVSARDWQKADVQWWRAKGSDTFGPIGPVLVAGLNVGDLRVQGRKNGQVVQDQRTSDLIHPIPRIISYLSRHLTLLPGDLVFTGTPGTTVAIAPGDVIEVEVEGVGVLRNPVTSSR